jgi:3-phenylpropionate/trans-cinnamate dioxygenase ferredoxin reductase subunit
LISRQNSEKFMTGHNPLAPAIGTVIVGAGEASLQLAVSLRQKGYTDPITIVGLEDMPPYQRPPLSKAFLAETMDEDNLALRANDFYAENRIEILTGNRVTDIELDDDGTGGTVTTVEGAHLPFARLALTTGARARKLTVPGSDLDGVCYLRSIPDARDLRARLARASRVVVIGGGFIGLEAASVARQRGLEVTVVETFDRLLQRVVAPPISDFYRTAHEKRGVQIILGSGVTALHGSNSSVAGVELSNGVVIPADLVIVGIGVEPRTELAEKLGLDCARGIVVDKHARTSNPAIVAAGDCTIQPHPNYPDEVVRVESVQNAVDQARVAALSLLGEPYPAPAVPWFWSDQGDLKLQIAGLSNGYDHYVVRGEPETEHFSVLYYRDGRLIATDAVNSPHDFMAAKRALATGSTIDPSRAEDASVPLKQLIG